MGGVFRFLTAGESHGEALVAVIDGVPAGLPLTEADINGDLARRQRGYGRGGRMKIERDQVHVLSGVRWGATLGSPITLSIANRDRENWKATMGVAVPEAGTAKKEVTRPRPGHADLAGAMKYGHRDIRNVLERSSARETTARVAVAGVAKRLLAAFGITILSHVTGIGGSTAASPRPSPPFRPSRASSWASASRQRGALAPPSTTRSSSTPTVAFGARATTPEASRVG